MGTQASQDVNNPIRSQQQRTILGLNQHRVRQRFYDLGRDAVGKHLTTEGSKTERVTGAIMTSDKLYRPMTDATVAVVEDPLGQ